MNNEHLHASMPSDVTGLANLKTRYNLLINFGFAYSVTVDWLIAWQIASSNLTPLYCERSAMFRLIVCV